jgi:hypothetical protein
MATPEWLQGVIDVMQQKEDAAYMDRLKVYNMAAADWITANLANRSAGRPLTPFTATPPSKAVFSADGFNLKQEDKILPYTVPSLPQETATTVAWSGTTGAPAQSDLLAQIYALVSQIAQRLGVTK